ncbi:hypothetical protein LQV05_003047 [Cryptococcus neoformans]|nr:hypothetical protein LQV05_003047 [Cryptococcus neoformans]
MSVRPLAAVRRFATSATWQDAAAASGFSAIRDLTSPPRRPLCIHRPPRPRPRRAPPAQGIPRPQHPAPPRPHPRPPHELPHEARQEDRRPKHGPPYPRPAPLLRQSVLLASPSIKILSMRKSAKTILTPRALNERQRTRQGIAWILKAAEKGRKGGVPRDQRIAKEVLAVLEGQSEVFKWLEDVHKFDDADTDGGRSNMNVR